jgi:NitT/TauT family transport system substrate-binding protein
MRLPVGKIVVLVAVLCALCIGAALVWLSREQPRKFDGPVEKLTLGSYHMIYAALILVAEDRGFFARQGLDVVNKHYDYGILAIEDLLAGKIDIAVAADPAVAWSILRKKDLKILAAIASSDILRLVARTDGGIRGWSDLKGKRVGLTTGTVSEFFLDRALTFNKLSRDDVELVHLEPVNSVDALKNKDVDAIAVWSPLDERAKERLGPDSVSWSLQYGQDYYQVLLCKSELPKKRPQAIQRLLTAVSLSENFVASNQAESKRIIAQRQGESPEIIDKMWPNHNFSLSLDQQMLLAMEDATRWRILKDRISNTKPPNFLEFMYLDGLRAVKPEAISIIH